MTVRELIADLAGVDQDKEVKVLAERDGKVTNGQGEAFSMNPAGQVIEYADYVGVTRQL